MKLFNKSIALLMALLLALPTYAAVPDSMDDLSTTANSNSPAGSESPISTDDFLRAIQSILRHTNAKGADIASATTTDIGAATGEFVDVTGTTTITGLGTIAAGIERTVRFTGALTLTHNATSLILPGAANITTAANDRAVFRSLGSGNWLCIAYQKADGSPVVLGGTATTDITMSSSMIKWAKGADVASAAALPLITDGNYFDVTGTTTVTSFNSVGVGTVVKLHFDDALILTHHATDLILPGGANITTAAGDEAEFVEYASGDFRCTSYTKANGTSVVGLNSGTVQSSPSGTTIDFTGLPSTIKQIHILINGLSTNGTSNVIVQLGDSGGVEPTGYVGAISRFGAAALATAATDSNGLTVVNDVAAADVMQGVISLYLLDAANNIWTIKSTISESNAATHFSAAGTKALTATLTSVRITTAGGANSFDNGNINIQYQ